MRSNLPAALALTLDRVGIKATASRSLGLVGREEGISAVALASVEVPE
jgi:2C-methyl-D-erythritol 2,4-cyclodiphosphate synthase